MLTIKILPNEKQNPPGKLADVELHFHIDLFPALDASHASEILAGLKLIGFGIWSLRDGSGRNVTFPARTYSVNGERRSFGLLRPITDQSAQDRLREAILAAYAEWEQAQADGTMTSSRDAEAYR